MFTKILLATDGSNHTSSATDKAIALAKLSKSDAYITVIHIIDSIPKKFQKTSTQDKLEQTKKQLEAANVSFHVEKISGDISNEIIRYANSQLFDVLVIGSRGLSSLQQFVLGSVSYKVAKKVKIPIFIVKQH